MQVRISGRQVSWTHRDSRQNRSRPREDQHNSRLDAIAMRYANALFFQSCIILEPLY